jgi:hypothetical protein
MPQAPLRITFRIITVIFLTLLIGGCNNKVTFDDSVAKLLDHASTMNPYGDVVVLESEGKLMVNEWFPVILYFGYAGNENMKLCLHEASRLRREDGREYRCTALSKR